MTLSSRDLEAEGVAVWFVEKTKLTFEQIATFCALPLVMIQMIANESLLPAPRAINPVERKLVTVGEIQRCSEDDSSNLERPISWRVNTRFSLIKTPPDIVPHKVSISKIYFLYYGRNAWHSTWITRYQSGSIEGKITPLMILAENLRTQGSRFVITELNAITLQADKVTLVGTEINNAGYFSKMLDLFNGPLFSRRIVSPFMQLPNDSAFWFQLPGNVKLLESSGDFTDSLNSWTSYTNGASEPLGWKRESTSSKAYPIYQEIYRRANTSLHGSITLSRRLRKAFAAFEDSSLSQTHLSIVADKNVVKIRALFNDANAMIEIHDGEVDYEELSVLAKQRT